MPSNNPVIIGNSVDGIWSTGVAAIQTGLEFVGCELSPRYFDIACERIENAQRQDRMFT
jgi:DNA modification methylase